MPRIALSGGSYAARSLSAGAQRMLNLYPEQVPAAQGEPAPFVEYPTPGLRLAGTAPNNGPIRCLFANAGGDIYCVAGNKFYRISIAFSVFLFPFIWLELGTLATSTGIVNMSDNGTQLLIASGEAGYYTFTYGVNTFAFVTPHPAGAGWLACSADYLDTFLMIDQAGTVGIQSGSPFFWVTDSGTTIFDPLSFAAKSSRADPLISVQVIHRNIWLIGESSVEVWYNSGGEGGALGFPFSLQPGAFIDHGCIARDSVAQIGNAVYFLSKQRAGSFVVVRGADLGVQRISNHALEDRLTAANLAGITITDAVGYCYSQSGHDYYVLSFPTLDETWVLDNTTGLCHERSWRDPATGLQHRHRGGSAVEYSGQILVGDWENGKIYCYDTTLYTDNGDPITRVRTFPHLEGAGINRIAYNRFALGMQCGTIASGSPTISLDWSDDGGLTYGAAVTQSLGTAGARTTSPQWRRLGYARSRVFRITWTAAMATVLTGAVIDIEESVS